MNKETIDAIQEVISLGASAVSEASRHTYIAMHEYIIASASTNLTLNIFAFLVILLVIYIAYKQYKDNEKHSSDDFKTMCVTIEIVFLFLLFLNTLSFKNNLIKLLSVKAHIIYELRDLIKR